MPLTASEVGALVEEAAPLLKNARLQDVHQPDGSAVVLTAYSASAGRLHLLFSTRRGLARFHLVAERPRALPAPPPFAEAARKHLLGARLQGLRQVSGDRLVEVAFLGEGGAALFLVGELLGGRGNVILLGAGREVLAALHPLRRAGAEVPIGGQYRFPEPRRQSGRTQGFAAQPLRYLETGREEPALAPGSAAEATALSAAPLHLALGRHYSRLEAAEVLRERREALVSRLAKERARRERALEKVAGDLARAKEGAEDRENGELLKSALGTLRRGMTSIEVTDFFKLDLPKRTIRLDPALAPIENVERCFKRYRKSRRAIPFLSERHDRLAAEAGRLAALAEEAGRAESLAVIEEVEDRARQGLGRRTAPEREGEAKPAGRGRTAGKAGKHAEKAPGGPRRHVSGDGFEVLVGRNAKENDHLTLRLGRGNDLFVHVAGLPGAHVLVRSVPGKTFPLGTILDAAHLALFYSLPERARGAASAGRAADVDYAPVKEVRKPRGAKPGLVLLRTHKTVRIRLDLERVERLRTGAGA